MATVTPSQDLQRNVKASSGIDEELYLVDIGPLIKLTRWLRGILSPIVAILLALSVWIFLELHSEIKDQNKVLTDIKETLSAVSMSASSSDERIGRIAAAVPDLKAKVAWEEVNFPLSGFVVATVPQRTDDNKWISSVKLYETETGKLQTYSLTLDENRKDFLAFVVAGKVRTGNTYAPSFAELAIQSNNEKAPVFIPASFNAQTSFVLRNADISEYSTFLKNITGQDPEVRKLGKLRNWKEVSQKLEEVQ